MRKLLIADHSVDRITAMENALQADWEIHSCRDSYPVIDTMRYIQPDAMIINLNIAPKDGLTVLSDAFPELPPVIMALTNFTSPYIEKTAASLGVGYMMLIPCRTEYIKERLNDMHNAFLETPTRIARHLRVLGINPSLSGYRCLLVAVPLFAEDPNQQMKALYPEIALRCELSNSWCAERDIRSAIADAWRRKNASTWSLYFPPDLAGNIACPTNKEFIQVLSERI